MKKFKNWLKPTGKLIILEHIHAEKNPNRFLQNIVNPVWKLVGDGCNLNRDTDVLIKEAGFKIESEEYFKQSLRFYRGIFTLWSTITIVKAEKSFILTTQTRKQNIFDTYATINSIKHHAWNIYS